MGIGRFWGTVGDYWVAGRSVSRWRESFRDLQGFVFFLGYPRSGHSLLGSVLDAHPEAVVAHEQDILRYLQYGFGRERLLALLMRNSFRTAEKGRQWSGYDYQLPGQYQGDFQRLTLIGDKKGANSTRRLARDPGLLDQLDAALGVPIHIVHVVRDPMDNISRMALRHCEKRDRQPNADDLRRCMEHYFFLADTVQKQRSEGWGDRFIDLRLEDLIADPRETLTPLLERLSLTPDEAHLKAAAALLFDSPKRPSKEVKWPRELMRELVKRVEGYPFLRGYQGP